MTGLAKRGIDVWKARSGIEVTVLLLGLLLGGSVGFGTIWFVLSIGPLVQFFLNRLSMKPPPLRTREDPCPTAPATSPHE